MQSTYLQPEWLSRGVHLEPVYLGQLAPRHARQLVEVADPLLLQQLQRRAAVLGVRERALALVRPHDLRGSNGRSRSLPFSEGNDIVGSLSGSSR